MTYADIRVERRGRVAIVTLDRPEVLNALRMQTYSELDHALADVESDDAIGALVVTGAGEKAFCAGGDIHEMASIGPEEMERRGSVVQGMLWHLAQSRKPTVGAINGLAYGGGALLSTVLDIRLGCASTRFRFLGAAYGFVNSTWSLPSLVGLPAAKELLFTGRTVESEEAYRMGLLSHLVPADELQARALELAGAIAANRPHMVQGIKELLHQGIGMGQREMWDAEVRARRGPLRAETVSQEFKEFLGRKGNQPRPD